MSVKTAILGAFAVAVALGAAEAANSDPICGFPTSMAQGACLGPEQDAKSNSV